MFRERQQVSRIAGLVHAAPYAPAGADKEVEQSLSTRSEGRRRLSARPNVVAFGTREWEEWGLWPAFSHLGQFSLFDYKTALSGAKETSSSMRRRLGKSFLAHVADVENTSGPVEVVFLYAAGSWVDPDCLAMLRERGIWTVLMGLDDKQQLPGRRVGDLEGWQLEAARSSDLYWTTWRSGVDWLSANGVLPWYAPEGADPEFFSPRNIERDIDVLWIGRGYGTRYGLVRWLRARGFDVKTYGPGWPEGMVPFEEMANLIARAHVVLGMGGVGQTDKIKHLKGRDFEVPMCGAVYLTSFNPELTDHFEIGREILCYSSEVDCAEILGYVLRRPALAKEIRAAARARCLSHHTWTARLERLFGLLRAADVPTRKSGKA